MKKTWGFGIYLLIQVLILVFAFFRVGIIAGLTVEIHPSFKLGGNNQTEAQVVVAIARVVVVTVRRTAILRIVVPAAATIHAVRPPLAITHFRWFA